ncbi:MAG TPA: radical SAM protein [Bacteroidales bacterium]|jgi:putative pyruvate formate lyase activating enzyme|nr:radical SAM protein [Bacteroidales bacterium]
MLRELDNCLICPRECGINRNKGQKGYCGYDSEYHIASIFLHRGEEPPISGAKGICNIFFNGCNLRCVYCQNFQISRKGSVNKPETLQSVTGKVIECLQSGAEAVGFVSPSHFVPHVKAIINAVHQRGFHPITVYNTNAYDKVEIIRDLEGLIDVYLPDFKYMDNISAGTYSGAADYSDFAKKAIKEMHRQKGNTVVLNENGQAITGIIVRHLVLPGHSKDSIRILEWIASELSPSVHISLMSQYYPTVCVSGDPVLDRHITHEEYNEVLIAMDQLGFYRGWIQEYESHSYYRPDFDKIRPFE